MPAGALVTVPLPAPALLTVSVKDCRAKVAVTVCAAFTVTVQVAVPEQPPPLQPAKVEPATGAAVKVTEVPLANAAAQVAPHATPAGALVTLPVPAPALLTVSVKVWIANVAVTEVAALIVTVQVPEPAQSPPLQSGEGPQAGPAGALVTLPVPAPPELTVSVKV